jgi:hypothetical protein
MEWLTPIQRTVNRQVHQEISDANRKGERFNFAERMNELITLNVLHSEQNGYLF